MKALVIGGSGFLGQSLLDGLVKEGHSVTCFHRTPSSVPYPFADVVAERVGERCDLPRFAPELSCDVVIDMVCANGDDFRHLVNAFAGYTCRLVMLSSADVYRAYAIMNGWIDGQIQSTPLRENSMFRTNRYPYRRNGGLLYRYYDKILVEEAAQESSELPTTTLRIPVVYGPGELHCFFRWYIAQMKRGVASIPFDDEARDWKGCWGYVENVASAVVAAAATVFNNHRVYNIADTWTPTHYAFLAALGEAIGWSGELHALSRKELPREALLPVSNPAQHWDLDTARIRTELKFIEPVPAREALARTVAWEIRSGGTPHFS
jgi:nucleoside-diphosphate-sugar epimerase